MYMYDMSIFFPKGRQLQEQMMCPDVQKTAGARRRTVHKERRCLAERQCDYSVWMAEFPKLENKGCLNVRLTRTERNSGRWMVQCYKWYIFLYV